MKAITAGCSKWHLGRGNLNAPMTMHWWRSESCPPTGQEVHLLGTLGGFGLAFGLCRCCPASASNSATPRYLFLIVACFAMPGIPVWFLHIKSRVYTRGGQFDSGRLL